MINITLVTRIVQALCLALLVILLFAACDVNSNIDIWAVKWVSCALVGLICMIEFCKDVEK